MRRVRDMIIFGFSPCKYKDCVYYDSCSEDYDYPNERLRTCKHSYINNPGFFDKLFKFFGKLFEKKYVDRFEECEER